MVRGSLPCANVTLPKAADDAEIFTPAPLSPAPNQGVFVRLKTSPRNCRLTRSFSASVFDIETDADGGRRFRMFAKRGLRLLSVNEGCTIHAAGSPVRDSSALRRLP